MLSSDVIVTLGLASEAVAVWFASTIGVSKRQRKLIESIQCIFSRFDFIRYWLLSVYNIEKGVRLLQPTAQGTTLREGDRGHKEIIYILRKVCPEAEHQSLCEIHAASILQPIPNWGRVVKYVYADQMVPKNGEILLPWESFITYTERIKDSMKLRLVAIFATLGIVLTGLGSLVIQQ